MPNHKLLLSGFDTIECAYYLMASGSHRLDFERLAFEKELIASAKPRRAKAMTLGCEEFLLAPHGTGSGYPFLLENDVFSIQCGQHNNPNFFVTFRSFALWHFGAATLHERFLAWASSIGFVPFRPERLSRVDCTFDYLLPVVDFDEDSFVTQFDLDNQHRRNRKHRTFSLGQGDLRLRLYDKSAEIRENSQKTWFYPLWGCESDVWRCEWQARKDWLRRFGIITFAALDERQGDLLRFLVTEHTTLRTPSDDSNRSRWPLHPLWNDLQEHAATLPGLGVHREVDPQALLEERLLRLGVSVYGYLKRLAAIHGLQTQRDRVSLADSTERLTHLLRQLHDPLTWEGDVKRRMDEMRLGPW